MLIEVNFIIVENALLIIYIFLLNFESDKKTIISFIYFFNYPGIT